MGSQLRSTLVCLACGKKTVYFEYHQVRPYLGPYLGPYQGPYLRPFTSSTTRCAPIKAPLSKQLNRHLIHCMYPNSG